MRIFGRRPRERRPSWTKMTVGLAVLFLAACGDGGSGPPGTLRFGQIGEVSVRLEIPLIHNLGVGDLVQVLTWNSTGAWQIRESISYRTLPGDENLRRTQGAEEEYAFLIAQLNDSPGLKLFEDLIPVLPEPCSGAETTVTFSIRDEPRDSVATWVRCAEGTLSTLETAEAGPDVDAVRVIQAAILLRDFTVRPSFLSAYAGSVPFGTLDRGEDSGALLQDSRAFFSPEPGSLITPEGWVAFWRAHTENPAAMPPVVDWANEMVFVAAVGRRSEAGDSVEIRRVLQTGQGTQVTQFERVPGNFCSPASGEHYPFHIIVAPRTLLPVDFSQPVVERVDCGF